MSTRGTTHPEVTRSTILRSGKANFGDSNADPELMSNEFTKPRRSAVRTKAVVLAGGRGTRLAPFTSVLPKPLMPIGDRAVLEILMEQLAHHGITEIHLCVGHLSHLIRAVVGNQRREGLRVRFVDEQHALGTAGPLRLVEGLDESFLVLNGDVLTTLDFAELLRFHRDAGHTLTIASHRRELRLDFGVIHRQSESSSLVARFEEKPELTLTVSMGIYVMEPQVLDYIPEAEHFDFPDLVRKLLDADLPVGSYLYDGIWFDIGLRDDYEQAVAVWERLESNVGRPLP
jgi:NDP-mannose synthase